jgi:hypothetical protein
MCCAEAAKSKIVQEPVYQFNPVLNENRWLWQFLHSVLMLLSFCFLLPLGSLLARHKWIFGRDPLSVSALAPTCLVTNSCWCCRTALHDRCSVGACVCTCADNVDYCLAVPPFLLQGRVLNSWGPVHVITQILGLLAAIGGVVIAILAFGWKDVPGQKLYLPHKWTGVGVIGMALIQVRVLAVCLHSVFSLHGYTMLKLQRHKHRPAMLLCCMTWTLVSWC